MALKGDRRIVNDKVDCFLNEAATEGVIATYSTYGSGVAMDNTKQLVTIAADPSGQKVAGVLVGNVVSIDVTREFLNTQKNEVPVGSKVHLVTDGFLVTDDIEDGTITAGGAAYVGHSGLFATAAAIAGYGALVTEDANATVFPMVGRFVTTKDQGGFAKVEIDIN